MTKNHPVVHTADGAASSLNGSESSTNNSTEYSTEPQFRIVHGCADAERLAALTAVLLTLTGSAGVAESGATSKQATRTWVHRDRLRLEPTPGPGSWRRSAWR